ncbi:MAG: N-6 DNA methylase [Pirellulaceae bacterium]|nr:N-6 DNA methylase [Pirellulaceae bacterium]
MVDTEQITFLLFWLNFLQHVTNLLKMHDRCAIVVPDNGLFEGGASETVRRKLLAQRDVHTLPRSARSRYPGARDRRRSADSLGSVFGDSGRPPGVGHPAGRRGRAVYSHSGG